jgi:uncharacterized protein (TIGR02145 family)
MNVKKTILFLIYIFCTLLIFGQPPQKMSYQAVIRDGNNQLVVNQQIGVKISILKHTPNGIAVYSETHSVRTNGNGLMSLEIGTGTPAPGATLSDIDWSDDDYYLLNEVDITGGVNYTLSGVQQLITVPYSFLAGTFVHGDYRNLDNRPPTGVNTGDILYWNAQDSSWHIISAGSEGEVLSMGPNNIPRWSIPGGGLGGFAPTVTTDTIFDITGRVAKVKATIVNPGSTGIIASGVCWSTTAFPSLGNNHTADGTSVGSFISTISGLTSGTVFYARAYATNSVGTSYGQPISFTTPTHCGTVTDYDGNTYQTIYIGAQCWMKENLKTTHYSNGASIPQGHSSTTDYMPYSGQKYYYRYNDADSNIATYGLLYSWAAVMNGAGSSSNNPSGIQGICPSGWHVPSTAEWCELEHYVEPGLDVNCNSTGYRGSMAKKLAAPQHWNTYSSNSFAPGYWRTDTTGFNTSGFSAIPAGRYKFYYGNYNSAYYENVNSDGYWWSCTLDNNDNIYYRYLNYANSGVYLTYTKNALANYTNYYAHSVRCIKN